MKKIKIIICIIFFIGCIEKKGPVIKLGKILDKVKLEIAGETSLFTLNNNLAYTLSQEEPFDTDIITRRIYKGKVYTDMISMESVDIKIKPDGKKIGESIPVREIIRKYGTGDYMILFIIDNSVIAKKSFSIEVPIIKKAARLEPQISEEIPPEEADKNTPLKEGEITNEPKPDVEITPKKADRNILSPSEMMKDTSKE